MKDIILSKQTEDFARVCLEACIMLEAKEEDRLRFVDRMCKVLPLLYLKAEVIPLVGEDCESRLEEKVSEEMYNNVERRIAGLMGDDNIYLETFHPDIKYSDTPVAVKISESLADIWQDLGNFIAVFRDGNPQTMGDSLSLCMQNFRRYWGQKLVNVLRALHAVRYKNE